ncbi:hypothetical protein Scep_025627 [Stephania cephalantha]|uniref:Uncharacterized protein n=1 Tax=Stephania cephalantha TaxID=152367 RepID=A0AAP0EP65_9MAGN
MSSSSIESDSSDDSVSIMKKFDELEETDSLMSTKVALVQTIAAHVSIITSTMMVDKKKCPHGGSKVGRRYIHRDRKERHELIINNYFRGDQSKYTSEHFRRRFRMDIELFMHILQADKNYDDYFTSKIDVTGKDRLSSL